VEKTCKKEKKLNYHPIYSIIQFNVRVMKHNITYLTVKIFILATVKS